MHKQPRAIRRLKYVAAALGAARGRMATSMSTLNEPENRRVDEPEGPMHSFTGKRFCLSVAAFLLSLSGASAHALSGGTTAAPETFVHVGSVNAPIAVPTPPASGVLIAPNWVLSAAHVGSVGGSFVSELGSATITQKFAPVTQLFPGSTAQDNDIGLLYLGSSLGAESIFPQLNSVIIDPLMLSSPIAATLTSGRSGTANLPAFGAVQITGVIDTATFEPDVTIFTPHWLITDGDVSVVAGDSGGGLFLGSVAGSAGSSLLGVASVRFTNTPLSGIVQAAHFRTWIDDTMRLSGQAAIWMPMSPVPEPATAAMFLIGFGFLHAWRRQKRQAPG